MLLQSLGLSKYLRHHVKDQRPKIKELIARHVRLTLVLLIVGPARTSTHLLRQTSGERFNKNKNDRIFRANLVTLNRLLHRASNRKRVKNFVDAIFYLLIPENFAA